MTVTTNPSKPEATHAADIQTGCPLCLYPVSMAANTIWELWGFDAARRHRDPGEIARVRHDALGAVAHQVVGGLRPAEPGRRSERLHPGPGPGTDWARVSYTGPAGEVGSEWRSTDGTCELTVNVPAVLEAIIVLPDGTSEQRGEARHEFTCGIAIG